MEITGSGIIFFECDQDKNIFDVILFESNRNGKSTYEDLGGKIDRKDINLFGSNGKKFGHFNAAKREAKEESNGYLNIDIELLYNLPNILIKNGKHNYFSSYFCIDSNGFDTNDFLSKNDLYVTINYNGYKRDTSIKYNTDLPTWNEEFLFPINYSIDTFIIEIKDKNMSSDKLLLKQIVHVNYHDLKDLYIDNKLCIQFGDIFYKKDYEINSLNNKIVDLEKEMII